MNGKDKREVSDEHTDTDVPFPFRSMVGTAPIECLITTLPKPVRVPMDRCKEVFREYSQ
jgi:hypothetical protein